MSRQRADEVHRHVREAVCNTPYVHLDSTTWDEVASIMHVRLRAEDLECLDEVVTFEFLAGISDVAGSRKIDFSDRDEQRGCGTCNHGGYGLVTIRIDLSDAKETT